MSSVPDRKDLAILALMVMVYLVVVLIHSGTIHVPCYSLRLFLQPFICLLYIPLVMVPGPGHSFKDAFLYQVHMFNYHSKLEATHPFSYQWWERPLLKTPVWLYACADVPAGMISSIVTMGSPAIWWAGPPAVALALSLAVKRRDRKMTVIFIAMAFQYLPWILVPRLSFIYHFFTVLPFVALVIVYVLKSFIEACPAGKFAVSLYLGLIMLFFSLSILF